MSNRQTDNSFFYDKIRLRVNHLPKKNRIKVLDAYSGDGKLWKEIIKISKKEIEIVRIDQKNNKKGIYLKGNNLKYLSMMNISEFDVIDLDAYGIPFKTLEIILDYHSRTKINIHIFLTFIQSMYGGLNKKMLLRLGYTKKMIKKCPSMFNKNGFEKFKAYLSLNNIKKIIYRSHNKKYYIFLELFS